MRARNIKPAFFQNELLTELPFAGRLLFIGLWTLADREGRLEDRPKRIKMQLFAMDDVDIDALLCGLDELGFINRYRRDGGQYIQIVNFAKHQRPHNNESQSVIPPSIEDTTSDLSEQDLPLRSKALRSESLNTDTPFTDSLNADTGLLDAEAREDAPLPTAVPKPPRVKKQYPVTPEAYETADVLSECSWINDDTAAIEQAVARSFAYVPEFDTRDGPLNAAKFTSHHAKKPPADWYRAWLNWIKNAVEFAKRDAMKPAKRNGVIDLNQRTRDNYAKNLAAAQKAGLR